MEKTKDQILISKLQKVGRRVRMGGPMGLRPGMPPMGEPPLRPGMPPMGGKGPGPDRPEPGAEGGQDFPPMDGREPRPGMPPMGGKGPRPEMPPMDGKRPRHGFPPAEGMFRGPFGRRQDFDFGGMPLPRDGILIAVLEAGDSGVRQKDIAAELGINASSLSEQIDSLEAGHYLERSVNPEDRRSTLISLTEMGRARAGEVLDERRKQAEDFCAALTEEEKDELIRLLDKLLGE